MPFIVVYRRPNVFVCMNCVSVVSCVHVSVVRSLDIYTRSLKWWWWWQLWRLLACVVHVCDVHAVCSFIYCHDVSHSISYSLYISLRLLCRHHLHVWAYYSYVVTLVHMFPILLVCAIKRIRGATLPVLRCRIRPHLFFLRSKCLRNIEVILRIVFRYARTYSILLLASIN